MQGRYVVRFQHKKHWEAAPTARTVWPLGLKEWAGRWYVLTIDAAKQTFRTFGLDRLTDVEVTTDRFPAPEPAFDAAAYFLDTYGVTRPTDGSAPVTLLLSFTWAQGRYVEDYPLHPSQQTLTRDQPNDEIRLSLRVYWTHEVLMALLAYGEDVDVIKPAEARAAVAAAHRAASGPSATE